MLFMRDKTSAGNWVPIAFPDSYISHEPEIEPQDFAVYPILLTQPANDRWMPLALGEPFLCRVCPYPSKP